jgi:hypothetical protein
MSTLLLQWENPQITENGADPDQRPEQSMHMYRINMSGPGTFRLAEMQHIDLETGKHKTS